MNRPFQQIKRTGSRRPRHGESGQALLEFSVVAVILIVLSFGLIDFARAIYLRQELVNLSRETANLAARGTGSTTLEIMTNALDAAVVSASPLALASAQAMVFVSAVTNNGNNTFSISEQVTTGSMKNATSRIGTFSPKNKNNPVNNAAMVTMLTTILPVNRTVYVAEIYYQFFSITPVGHFFKGKLPSQLYDAAYFSGI